MFPIEVKSFSTKQSTPSVFQILERKTVSAEEKEAAASLAEQLDGPALAFDITANNIKSSKQFSTIAEFQPYYEEEYRHAPYSKELSAVWETAFATLDPDAMLIMQILCFLATEAIPQSLFMWKIDEDNREFSEVPSVLVDGGR